MKYALIGAIESEFNDTNVNTGICEACKRRLESEAIECFTAWRENGGWLKDIDIYAVCPTKNVISEETKEKFKELNVTYIEEYQPVTETFTSGFLNIPLVGMMMEQRLNHDVFIKIDLDMNLIKPLPERWVNSEQIIVGQYDDYCTKHQRVGLNGNNPLDTGFMITRRESGIYKKFFDEVMLTMGSDDPNWLKVKAQTGEYYLEEYVMDKIHASNEFDIQLVQKYQVGEWYTPVNELSDDELREVYFWHEHLEYDPLYDKFREKIDFFKRMKDMT
jgi:hypothetical protein